MGKYRNIIIFVVGAFFGASIMYVSNQAGYKIVKEVTEKAIEQPSTEVNNTTEIDIKNKKGTIALTDTIKTEEPKKKKRFFNLF